MLYLYEIDKTYFDLPASTTLAFTFSAIGCSCGTFRASNWVHAGNGAKRSQRFCVTLQKELSKHVILSFSLELQSLPRKCPTG